MESTILIFLLKHLMAGNQVPNQRFLHRGLWEHTDPIIRTWLSFTHFLWLFTNCVFKSHWGQYSFSSIWLSYNQWSQWPQQPNIIKTPTEHDATINLATKWPILVSQCGMNQQKFIILWIFCHSCCWRLWRPWMLLSTKSKGHKSNVRIS